MIERRDFLKMGAMTAMAAAALPEKAHGAVDNTKVYTCYDDAMVSGTTVDAAVVKTAVESCFKAMAGTSTVADAIRAVFPGVTASSKIAIKINCLNTSISPRFEAVKALIECLKTVVNGANISLFDNNLWTTAKVDKAYGASNLNALGIWHGEDSYGSPTVNITGRNYYVSQRIQAADFGISLAALKPHQYYAGYLSGTIKNMMGAVSTSTSSYTDGERFHSGATPFANLFSGYMNSKLHLYFVDMIFGTRHENYSSWTKVVKRITMGTSPSRVDAYMVQVIKDVGLNAYNTTTLVPAAVGPTGYTRVDVTASTEPPKWSREDAEKAIRDHKAGSVTEAGAQGAVNNYLIEANK
jgi:uncharacterized protein (DUF362 family)